MTRPSNVCFKNIAQLLCTAFVNRNEHTQVKKNTSHECSMILWFERIWFYNILQPFHIWLRFSLDRRCHGPWAHWLLILLTYLASKKEDEKWANDWPILGKSLGYSWILPVFYVGLSIFLGASWVASCGAWPRPPWWDVLAPRARCWRRRPAASSPGAKRAWLFSSSVKDVINVLDDIGNY